jgi:NtrC-family two-component system response regulator AlgB
MNDASNMPSSSLQVLVVDDEANIRRTLSICLEEAGHAVVSVGNFQDALYAAARRVFDMAFVDLRLGVANGLDLVQALLAEAPWIKIVVITAYASIDTAVEAMRRGATDYLPKPFSPVQVRAAARQIAELRALEQRVATLEETLDSLNPEMEFASASPAMQKCLELARQIAPANAILLLRGESGTGKTMLARAVHAWSDRASRPFGVVSCPALPAELLESELFGHVKGAFTGAVRDNPGRIALCEGGTLLLDEIGDLPLPIQPKLLRFIQDRQYERIGDQIAKRADVRLIAATNVDLEQAVAQGRFREDLFYRLNVVQVAIPPLRERVDDLEPLAHKLLQFFGRNYHKAFRGFTQEAVAALKSHSWPGNVRELRNVIERAALLARQEWIGLEDLPDNLAGKKPLPQLGDLVSLKEIEEMHIRRVLAATRSLQEAAQVLDIDQATLWRRRKLYGL